MSKKWSEHTAEEQKAIGEAVCKVYADNGHPAGLDKPVCGGGDYVNILQAKKKQEQNRPFMISGKFKKDEKETADRIKAQFKTALETVSGSHVEFETIAIKPGEPVITISDTTNAFGSGDMESIEHKKG